MGRDSNNRAWKKSLPCDWAFWASAKPKIFWVYAWLNWLLAAISTGSRLVASGGIVLLRILTPVTSSYLLWESQMDGTLWARELIHKTCLAESVRQKRRRDVAKAHFTACRTINEVTHRSDDIRAYFVHVGMEENRDLRGIQSIATKIQLPAFTLDKSSMLVKTDSYFILFYYFIIFYFILCSVYMKKTCIVPPSIWNSFLQLTEKCIVWMQAKAPQNQLSCKLNIKVEFSNAQYFGRNTAFSDLLASSKASLALFSICLMEMSKEVANSSPLIDQYCIYFLLVSLCGWSLKGSNLFHTWKTARRRLPARKRKWVKFLLFIAVLDPLFPQEVNLAHGLGSLLLGV